MLAIRYQPITGETMNFQELIFALERFWADQGCVIQQPYDTEVGAGTFHPATFLRSLGPEPWRVAYVEPSRRPTDGRYGENPKASPPRIAASSRLVRNRTKRYVASADSGHVSMSARL